MFKDTCHLVWTVRFLAELSSILDSIRCRWLFVCRLTICRFFLSCCSAAMGQARS
jgi:hypothetical protein